MDRDLERDMSSVCAMMMGNRQPAALCDLRAAPRHVLPTGRAGRCFSGLRVGDFLRRTRIVRYDEKSIRAGEKVVRAFAGMEKLDAHGRSASIRLEK